MTRPPPAGSVAIIGGGVIGGGWAARFLLHGWDAAVFDPNPGIRDQVQGILDNARVALPALADAPMPPEGKLTVAASLADAVAAADWVQESVPEDLAAKRRVIAEIEAHAPAQAILASSTSGFKPSELQAGARHPGRVLVAHPFNPVYLLPAVEIVPGSGCDPDNAVRAVRTLAAAGMKPLVVHSEIDAHVADRLMEALWREALWLVNDDIATTGEIDEVMQNGFGLRWAQMGLFETFRLAGGEQGMAHFMRQFGPALSWPWTKLTDVPELNEALVQKIAAQSDAQSSRYTFRELERIRDRNLVGILRALKDRDWGAGAVLNAHDRELARRCSMIGKHAARDDADLSRPLILLSCPVLPAWIDYNGHMTDFRYAEVFSRASDALLRLIGMDADYVAAGSSYYTVETHINFHAEVGVHAELHATAQVLMADARRLHVYFELYATADNRLLASSESMYLHVDRESGRVCEAGAGLAREVRKIARAHARLPRPAAAGRYVGQRD